MIYEISYGCTTIDEIIHVSEFDGDVDESKDLSKIVDFILKEINEEIVSLNISFKLKTNQK